ncbi:hypothetical protein J0667_16505 [Methylomonas sp. WH-1]|uniref:hypothetical protein n=1 Tax=unclassified Methylomonas TaxID=2608980 RepID=UPI0010222CF9|nr:hypothetical protein [Methylomonas sp. LW13]
MNRIDVINDINHINIIEDIRGKKGRNGSKYIDVTKDVDKDIKDTDASEVDPVRDSHVAHVANVRIHCYIADHKCPHRHVNVH